MVKYICLFHSFQSKMKWICKLYHIPKTFLQYDKKKKNNDNLYFCNLIILCYLFNLEQSYIVIFVLKCIFTFKISSGPLQTVKKNKPKTNLTLNPIARTYSAWPLSRVYNDNGTRINQNQISLALSEWTEWVLFFLLREWEKKFDVFNQCMKTFLLWCNI